MIELKEKIQPNTAERVKPQKIEHDSASDLLERSTARRESSTPGISSRAKSESFENRVRAIPLKPFPTKHEKLYDRNAEKLAASAQRHARELERKAEQKKMNARLGIALAIILCLSLALFFAIPEVTRITKVSVRGMQTVSETDVVSALGLSSEIHLFNANIAEMEKRISADPRIASVRIQRVLPDKLVVNLAERVPVAVILHTDEFGTQSLVVDREGVVFGKLDGTAQSSLLPVLSGIRFEQFTPGQRLPSMLLPLLADLDRLEKNDASLLNAFSEIKIMKVSEDDAELVLYPVTHAIPIRTQMKLDKAMLGEALLVLDILASRKGTEKIQEIDFRTGTIVYRVKEAQAG